MNRLLLGLALSFAGSPLIAQTDPARPAAPAPQGTASQGTGPQGTGAPAAEKPQDPDRPHPKAEDTLADLEREKARLTKEIAFVRERAAMTTALLREKFGTRQLQTRAIDAGLSATATMTPTAVTTVKRARLLTDQEKQALAADVLMTVDGHPVSQAAFDALMTYLKTFPSSGDEATRAQRAMHELIRIESMTAALAESTKLAEKEVAEAVQKLKGGQPFAEVAKVYSRGPGAQPEGKITVSRFCALGFSVEAAAFLGKEGEMPPPIRSLNGFVMLQIDKQLKGETPDADQVEVHVIQVPYHSDPNEVDQARQRANIGKVDIAVRDAKVYETLPAYLRPLPGALESAQPGKVIPKVEEPGDGKPKDETKKPEPPKVPPKQG